MRKLFAIAIVLFGVAAAAFAQPYPSRPVRIVVPYTPGGGADTTARLIAPKLQDALGQTVVIDKKPGAGGTIGAARVARSAPDGYTLFLHHIGHSTAPSLYRKLSYNAITDFEPIGLINEVPMTLIARRDFPPKEEALV